jgi:hypothetical protein
MLTPGRKLLATAFAATVVVSSAGSSARAQDLQPHRAAYDVALLDHGKPGPNSPGTYAFELRRTCEGYIINQRLRLELDGSRSSVVTEQLSQMTESRDGRKLHFEHRTSVNGRQTSLVRGDATLGEAGQGRARFSDPDGQSVALPPSTLFPMAMTRATLKHAAAGEMGFNALFFFGEKPNPPQLVNVVIGRVPKRLADLQIPDGGVSLVKGHSRVYYRGGFFDADAKKAGEPAAFEMSSLTLDNGIELYGTHEEGDGGGIQYRISRLEALPSPNCN